MRYIYILSAILILSSCGSIGIKKEVFSVDLNSRQIPIGTVEIQLNKFLSIGGLKKIDAEVIYFPNENAVCLKYRHEFNTVHFFWSYVGRQALIDGLKRYNESYDARSLSTRGKKTIKEYGTVLGYIYWQMASFTILSRGNADVNIGYQFKNRSPYFTILQGKAEYRSRDVDESTRTSASVTMYFTRAQAKELAALFDQELLTSIAAPPTTRIDNLPPPDANRDYY